SGSLGYNSKTGKLTPENPKDAITVDQPKLDENAMKGVVMGDTAPASVKTKDKDGKELSESESLMCTPAQPQLFTPVQNQSVMPKRGAVGDAAPRSEVDESIVTRLGSGTPLDLATRGFFEQRMGADLSRVRI